MPRISMSNVRWTPRLVARLVVGVLAAVNLITAALVFRPWEGSTDSLARKVVSLKQELKQKRALVDRLKGLTGKVQTARTDGDKFMDSYLLGRRTVSSTLLDELDQTARKAGLKQKDVTFAFEPVEGSDTLMRAEITANYEGGYPDLTHFLNLLDHSPRLLIIDSLAATPQPPSKTLEVAIKLNAFVREGADAGQAVPTAGQPSAAPEQASAQLPGRTR